MHSVLGLWSILSHTESFINESEACMMRDVILKTAVNINDDSRHLSKQRQVSFLIYGNFDRFEISFFAMIVFAWRYARSYTQCNCENLQRIDQTEKKIFWECLSDSVPSPVRSRISLDADTYENGFHEVKNIEHKMMFHATILIWFSIIFFYNV